MDDFVVVEIDRTSGKKPIGGLSRRDLDALRQPGATGNHTGKTILASDGQARRDARATGKSCGVHAAQIDGVSAGDVTPHEPDRRRGILEIARVVAAYDDVAVLLCCGLKEPDRIGALS